MEVVSDNPRGPAPPGAAQPGAVWHFQRLAANKVPLTAPIYLSGAARVLMRWQGDAVRRWALLGCGEGPEHTPERATRVQTTARGCARGARMPPVCTPSGASRRVPRSPSANPARCAPAASVQVDATNACGCFCPHALLCVQLCAQTSCTSLQGCLCAYTRSYTRTHDARWPCLCALAGEPLLLGISAHPGTIALLRSSPSMCRGTAMPLPRGAPACRAASASADGAGERWAADESPREANLRS